MRSAPRRSLMTRPSSYLTIRVPLDAAVLSETTRAPAASKACAVTSARTLNAASNRVEPATRGAGAGHCTAFLPAGVTATCVRVDGSYCCFPPSACTMINNPDILRRTFSVKVK